MGPFHVSLFACLRRFMVIRVGPRILILFAMVLVVSANAWSETTSHCPLKGPLTLPSILADINNKANEEVLVSLIKTCRVGFPLDAQALDRLATAKAAEKILDALNEVTTSQLTVEQAKSQVSELQRHIEEGDKAGKNVVPYRERVAYLQQSAYPDRRTITYSHYSADTLKLAVNFGGEEYWFDKVPPKTAETMVKDWPKVKATQPYGDNEFHTRTLVLDEASISVTGIPSRAIEEPMIAEARARMARHDCDGAIGEFQSLLALDPNNQAVKGDVAAARAERQKQAAVQAAMIQEQHAAGEWVDPQTRLMWTLTDNGGDIDWDDAFQYCQALRTGGYSDWRLAAPEELVGIYDPASNSTTTPTINSTKYMYNGVLTKAPAGTTWPYHIKGGITLTNTGVWSGSKENSGPNAKGLQFDFKDGKGYRRSLHNHTLLRVLCVRPVGLPVEMAKTSQPVGGAQGMPQPEQAGTSEKSDPSLPEMRKPSDVAPRIARIERQARSLYDQKRFTEAFPLANQACLGGDADGCGLLATMYFFGQGVAEDKPRGSALAFKACDAGSAEDCNGVGDVYYWGLGAPRDWNRAADFYAKSCNLSFALGCDNLARCYLSGNGVDKNPQTARQLYDQSCSLGYAKACSEARDVHLR
ncbi:MAG: DUF1566 domain-containing protein [Terriglobia bacterium]